jgi:hypothetical protein
MERLNFDAESLDLEVECPAGEKVAETREGPACYCRIEGSLVTAARDPSSLGAYCMGAYVFCPTWREHRVYQERTGHTTGVVEHEERTGAIERSYGYEDLAEIQSREDEGDFAGADEKRREILERKRARGLAPGL